MRLDLLPDTAPAGRGGHSSVESVALSQQQLLRAVVAYRLGEQPRARAALGRARGLLGSALELARFDLAADLPQAEAPLLALASVAHLEHVMASGIGIRPPAPQAGFPAVTLAAGSPGLFPALAAGKMLKCDAALHNLALWHRVWRLARVTAEAAGAGAGAGVGGGGGRGGGVWEEVEQLRLRVVQVCMAAAVCDVSLLLYDT